MKTLTPVSKKHRCEPLQQFSLCTRHSASSQIKGMAFSKWRRCLFCKFNRLSSQTPVSCHTIFYLIFWNGNKVILSVLIGILHAKDYEMNER